MTQQNVTRTYQASHEIGGGLGDLGVLLPLAILLIVNNGLSPVAVFTVVGLHYLITGWYFKIPLPVQPLKAMAVIAIATGATPQMIGATGLWMGLILLLLSLGNLAEQMGRIFTKPIVRGIQLAIGFFLAKQGLMLIMDPVKTFHGVGLNYPWSWFPILIGVIAGLLILLSVGNPEVPTTFIVLPLGLLIGFVLMDPAERPTLGYHWTWPVPLIPTWNDFSKAFFLLVLPQIPLTFANSIVSCYHVAQDYFGERAKRVTPRALACSLGFGNLIGGALGGLPCCHGAGGLTAHYALGARTGRATIFIGLCFMVLGFLFGDSVHQLFAMIPAPVLGALLIYVGVEHTLLIQDILPHRQAAFLALLIGVVSAGTGNIAIGFVVGMVVGFLMRRIPAFRWDQGT